MFENEEETGTIYIWMIGNASWVPLPSIVNQIIEIPSSLGQNATVNQKWRLKIISIYIIFKAVLG